MRLDVTAWRAGAASVLFACLHVALSLGWLETHSLRSPPTWDPANYQRLSLLYLEGWRGGGAPGLAAAVMNGSPYLPPLLPLSSVPFYLLFGRTRLAAHLASALFLVLFLAGAFLLAARRAGPRAGLLAVFLLGSFTATLNLSRDYQMDFPAAALVTLSLVALDRGRDPARRALIAACGALAGLAVVAKTVSGVFLAGPVVWAARDARRNGRTRREVLGASLIAAATAATVAAPWWARHGPAVFLYVGHHGFGAGAAPYNPTGRGIDFAYYALALFNDGIGPALTALLAMVAAVGRRPGPRDGEERRTNGLLWFWLAGGYVALSLVPNKAGERYTAALLPPIAALAAAAIVRTPSPAARRGLVAAAAVLGSWNIASWTWSLPFPSQVAVWPPRPPIFYRPGPAWLRTPLPVPLVGWPTREVSDRLAGARAAILDVGAARARAAQSVPGAGAAEEQVRAAYRQVLRRPADPFQTAADADALAYGVTSPAALVERLLASDEWRQRKLRVLVLPDHPFVNAATLNYYAVLDGRPLLFVRDAERPVSREELDAYDAVVAKAGGYQGLTRSTAGNDALLGWLGSAGSGFRRLEAAFRCPDDSVLEIYAPAPPEPSLRLAAERAAVGPRVQRLAAVPAEAFLGDLAGLEPLADVVELAGLVVDVGGRGQVLEDLRGPLIALAQVGGDRLHHDVGDLLGDMAVADARRRAASLRHQPLDLRRVGAEVGQGAGQHLVQDHAHGIDVRGQHRAARELLRRHVGRAADDGGRVALLEQAAGAEVGHLQDTALREQDVGRAQVAVEDLGLVRVLNALQDLDDVVEGARDVEALLAVEHGLQALALDVVHHDEEDALHPLRGQDADDVGVVEGGQEARLLEQVVEVPALAVGDLDGDLLVDPGVLGEIDRPEPAGAQVREDLILPDCLSQQEHEAAGSIASGPMPRVRL
jgi:dolichyl-phosphate-mannose-protein mannosyltransferase